MHEIEVRLYAELNDFVPPAVRGRSFLHRFWGNPSVKDVIEALGVPHTEVELILINGRASTFAERLAGGERVAAYPVFEEFDLGSMRLLHREALRCLRFCADGHLGSLARYLRLLGFDTWYRADAGDEELSSLVAEEGRVLLTRDRGLLKRSEVERGYCVREDHPDKQLAEVVERFHLGRGARPFTRCLRCNGILRAVPPELVETRVPLRVLESFSDFTECSDCGRVYWRGTHYQAMVERLVRIGVCPSGPNPKELP